MDGLAFQCCAACGKEGLPKIPQGFELAGVQVKAAVFEPAAPMTYTLIPDRLGIMLAFLILAISAFGSIRRIAPFLKKVVSREFSKVSE
jgi:hypothetical protein